MQDQIRGRTSLVGLRYVPGKQLTQRQVTRYMSSRQAGDPQAVAAAKAGISERSGRRIESGQRYQRGPREYRTRQDPFAEVWESVLEIVMTVALWPIERQWL